MPKQSKELFQRGEIWWFRFTHPKSGQQVRQSAGTRDKEAAQAVLDQVKAQAWQEQEIALGITEVGHVFGEAVLRWYEEKSEEKRSIHTDMQRLQVIGDALDTVALDQITNEFIYEKVVKGVLNPRGLKTATIKRYLVLIQSILNKCEKEWGWLQRAPKLSKPSKSLDVRRKAWLTPDQVNIMLKGRKVPYVDKLIPGMPEYKAEMAIFGICTGMRADNIFTLHPSWVDLSNSRITIPAEFFKGKRQHTVPLNETAKRILKKSMGRNADRVFLDDNGEPFERLNLRFWHSVFERLGINGELRAAGLLSSEKNERGAYVENFVFHGLRHTFATWLHRSGVPVEIIEAIGGWANGRSSSVHIYTHIDDVSHLLQYVRLIDDILDGKRKVI
ncbi:tyrosine-type recombinase/integrase [Methylobacillus sp.]|uniref:tyrosine-type recombinase/integrase n=1 Tax=Methylobacillus sp. TaxID=56818 RepID=UPI0012C07472|nr:tyrosine-type recombinase/integrase [Methylobacillus sp.]MPS48578.1 hypothetical protein [Methylobacillus sp.]